jgi:hypothetical protein
VIAMKAPARIVVLGAAAVLMALSGAHSQPANPGAPGGGLRAGGANRAAWLLKALYLERAWQAVSFDLETTDEQLLQLRPRFQAAQESRKKAFQDAAGGDPAGRALALSEAIDEVQKDVDGALGDVLTEDQLAKWEEIKSDPTLGGFGGGLGALLGMARPGAAPQQQPWSPAPSGRG